jgi:hypothetical protein
MHSVALFGTAAVHGTRPATVGDGLCEMACEEMACGEKAWRRSGGLGVCSNKTVCHSERSLRSEESLTSIGKTPDHQDVTNQACPRCRTERRILEIAPFVWRWFEGLTAFLRSEDSAQNDTPFFRAHPVHRFTTPPASARHFYRFSRANGRASARRFQPPASAHHFYRFSGSRAGSRRSLMCARLQDRVLFARTS